MIPTDVYGVPGWQQALGVALIALVSATHFYLNRDVFVFAAAAVFVLAIEVFESAAARVAAHGKEESQR